MEKRTCSGLIELGSNLRFRWLRVIRSSVTIRWTDRPTIKTTTTNKQLKTTAKMTAALYADDYFKQSTPLYVAYLSRNVIIKI